MSVYDTLRSLAIEVPKLTAPDAAFTPYVQTGDLVFVAGHIARQMGKPWIGRLGSTMSTADGQTAARAVAIDILGTLHSATGNLNAIDRIVKLLVLVNSSSDFVEQHVVANGASELLQSVFGPAGVHARSAFGVMQLPFGSCVEIEAIVRVR